MPGAVLSADNRFLALLLAAPVLTTAACASPAPAPVAPVALASTDAAPAAPAVDAGPPEDDLATRLCAGRTPCSIRRNRSAGRGEHGEALAVVSLNLGMAGAQDGADDDAGDGAAAAPDPNDLQESAMEDQTSGPAGFQRPCHSFEYWLVTDAPDGAPQLLAAACNDGYGASMVGIDVMTIGNNSFKRTQGGGSSWRWSYTNELTLSPLRLASSTHAGYWSVSTNNFSTTWDWVRFAGSGSFYAPACNDKGEMPDDPAQGKPYASIFIPRLGLPDGYRTGGFRDTALGACAAEIDGTGQHGYVTFGSTADHAAAWVRAVLSDHDELFVEVHDAHPSGASGRWVADDHLEIWTATVSGGFDNQCIPTKEPPPKQWGIRLADGKVFAGYGSPKPAELTVERAAKDDGLVRFRIGLPHEYQGITVAYSDGDGRKQQRLFATSIARKGVPETVGAAFDIKADQAVCEVKDGRLEPRITYARKPDQAFADETP